MSRSSNIHPFFYSVLLFFFIFRIQAYVRNSWATNIVDPDGKSGDSSQQYKVSLQTSWFPVFDTNAVWRPLRNAFPPSNPINFTNAEIVNYFVIKRTIDGLPASDVKA